MHYPTNNDMRSRATWEELQRFPNCLAREPSDRERILRLHSELAYANEHGYEHHNNYGLNATR
jgi:hypothetical protein